jgi:hypothetical protein
MESGFDRERLRKWLSDIASTEDEEVDCQALEDILETVVAMAEGGQDIREVLPDIAVHMDHCPECAECYETLVALAREAP